VYQTRARAATHQVTEPGTSERFATRAGGGPPPCPGRWT